MKVGFVVVMVGLTVLYVSSVGVIKVQPAIKLRRGIRSDLRAQGAIVEKIRWSKNQNGVKKLEAYVRYGQHQGWHHVHDFKRAGCDHWWVLAELNGEWTMINPESLDNKWTEQRRVA